MIYKGERTKRKTNRPKGGEKKEIIFFLGMDSLMKSCNKPERSRSGARC